MKRLKAVVKARPEPGVEVRDLPIPDVAPGEVLIRVKAAAICGSDLGIYNYTPAYSAMKLPVVMGHEFSGEIAALGNHVEGYSVGDRVLSESVKACGECGFCKQGMSNLCDGSTLFGIHTDGGFAEYVAVPYTLLHRIPDGMTYEEAALVEPLSNAIHFVRDITPFEAGDLVVVQGCGPIGLFSAQLFRLGGARVLMTGLALDEARFGIARSLGLDILNVEEESLEDRVMEMTGGDGADIAFVAVGAPEAARQATRIVKKRGNVTVVGIFGREVPLDMTWLVRRELVIRGAYDARPANFPESIALIAGGDVDVGKVLTHRFRLEEAEEAFRVALDRTGGKVVFKP
ncbi:alcohol dehydrogenase catalytic domain-containing protein [Candidatus Bathyarchaeota archaeon]|nr:alcohol dehydrogenase catalytic domain-containing protein [Candidatus Bathyarchaeota archaeon]